MTAPTLTWLSLDQACDYTGMSRETVRRAAVEYQQTNGKAGLRAAQRKQGARWRVTTRDLDRWLEGEPPLKPSGRSG